MRKIFILGGSDLQLDLILEAKKMFFYTIVIDMDKNCIGKDFCDEFLYIDISNKEMVLQKAIEYKIDMILTSATELGNLTACYVGEKLGLNTNSYQTALNTTNKKRMKEILCKNNISTAEYKIVNKNELLDFDSFPYIVKPYDSSAGRGLSFIQKKEELAPSINKALLYSKYDEVIIEEYIEGRQFSVETITCKGTHQIVALNEEFIRDVPNIIEIGHMIPANCEKELKDKIATLTHKILNAFDIGYGACHIELRVTNSCEIIVIELASRTGGMRSEMINLAYGISYSQLLLLSGLDLLSQVEHSRDNRVRCNFIIDYAEYEKYKNMKRDTSCRVFEPRKINEVNENFIAYNLGESRGYYYILEEEPLCENK